MKRQPARSPDMNVLDLGFFNSIQSLQNKKQPKSVDELIEVVKAAFHEDANKKNLNKVFLSLQQAMLSVLECRGNNNCRHKHMGKDKLMQKGALPVSLKVPQELIDVANELIAAPDDHFLKWKEGPKKKKAPASTTTKKATVKKKGTKAKAKTASKKKAKTIRRSLRNLEKAPSQQAGDVTVKDVWFDRHCDKLC